MRGKRANLGGGDPIKIKGGEGERERDRGVCSVHLTRCQPTVDHTV